MKKITIALAQINPTVGAIFDNCKKISASIASAKSAGASLVLLPELAVVGYPPEDLLLNSGFIKANLKALEELAKRVRGITAIVGFVDSKKVDGRVRIYNAAAVLNAGRIAGVYHKMSLPNYGVFDEQRYFTPGTEALNIVIGDITVGVCICEDIWSEHGPISSQVGAGAEVMVNINASPYHTGKAAQREKMLSARATENNTPILYVNAVGAQDELVFDGRSLVVDRYGKVTRRGRAFEEELLVEEFALKAAKKAAPKRAAAGVVTVNELRLKARGGVKKAGVKKRAERVLPALSVNEEVYGALVLGTRDYVKKNGFTDVVIALSGGIDSALVAVIAAEAVGAEHVKVLFMPTRYSAKASAVDAKKLAVNLGVEFIETSIEKTFIDYLELLKPLFKGKKTDATEENLQARIRGNIIMAMSNKFNSVVLTTGNKSEMSVGYATLYGDMAGGFAVIKDLPKMLVYKLSKWINRRAGHKLIPNRIITRAPSAELRADQTDQDTLPPYEVLDAILKAYVEEDRGVEEIVRLGFERKVVCKIIRMVDFSEYKRRQAPPGVKITPRGLGKDRRMPITNRYSGGTEAQQE